MIQILVIDDEDPIRNLLARMIELEGYKVWKASDCQSALKLLKAQPFDVVLCDVFLPDGNGVDFIREIKKHRPEAEVILLTAHGNIPDGVQAIKNGAFDYITKGDDNRKIIPTISRAVDEVEKKKGKVAPPVSYSFDSIIGSSNGLKQAVALARKVADTDVPVLLTGEISDELFGYKYTDFAPSPEAFQQEAEKRVRELHMYDVLRADRCISVNSLEARVPFGDLEFVRYVMSLDPALKVNTYGKGKYLLRRAFEGDYLPQAILWREKAAFSDAVGHSLVDDLKEYAETHYTDEEFETLRRKYTHAQPFTKESLLYREIFEYYYPGQSRMVTDFWMPNKSWAGCDVNDPSARVLANYGASGV